MVTDNTITNTANYFHYKMAAEIPGLTEWQ